MASLAQALAIGIGHHRAGQHGEAEKLYRQILAADPQHADALHLMGVLAHQKGDPASAVAYLERAIAASPLEGAFHCSLGNAWKAQGRLDQAVAAYRRAVELTPGLAEAYNNLGNALSAQGNLEQALWAYRNALRLRPDYPEAQNNLGLALEARGEFDKAVAAYEEAIRLRPDYAAAHVNLGNAMRGRGRSEEAVKCYQCALQASPAYVEVWINLGNAWKDQGLTEKALAAYQRAFELNPTYAECCLNIGNVWKQKGRLEEATAWYRRALSLAPRLAEAHNNLGVALQDQGSHSAAAACYRQAIELKPDYAEAHHNLGNVLSEQGHLDDATGAYRRAIELNPGFAEAWANWGNVLKLQGNLDAAVGCYRKALDLMPGHRAALGQLVHQLQHMCSWGDLEELWRQTIEAVGKRQADGTGDPVSPFCFVTLGAGTTAADQLECARAWVSHRLGAIALSSRPTIIPTGVRPEVKIRLGYLSSDFHSHPTAELIAELIEKHDRDHFEVYGYSYGPDDGSAMRQRLVKAFDRFVDLRNVSFAEAADGIRQDGIEILVDLKGYTRDARTQILALRPAPIQVNYLGYPGTMGAPFIDYILVDDFVVPYEQQAFFSERLVHLPGCYQVNDSRREIAACTPSRIDCGLPDEAMVFCSFNNNYKITPEVFDVWMELLREVSGSVLWLFEGNRYALANLRREAEARGVAADRLVFAPRLPLHEHLARHRLADLFLDTYPVNAHTTASDALWAGCPVLTRAGETFVSRVAGSLLRAVGLPELITTSLAEYRERAMELAADTGQLVDLRRRLAACRTTCGLFQADGFARGLEEAFLRMSEVHRSGKPPESFAVAGA